MSVIIYLLGDRIIHWTPNTLFTKPANVNRAKWYMVNTAPPVPMDEIVADGNYCYNFTRGYFKVSTPPPEAWEEREHIIRCIQIIGGVNTLANTQRLRYTDNSIGQPLTDVLLLEEIREYRKTKKLDDCTILSSMIETDQGTLEPEALVSKIWLRYESFRNVVAYLNKLEVTVRKMLQAREYDQATELLNNEFEKIRM
jgi:hypothetical protein